MDVATDDKIATVDGAGNVQEKLAALNGLSNDEISRVIMTDPDLYKVVLENQDQLEEILQQSTAGESAAAAIPQGDATPEEKPVNVMVKPSWLGTYGVNRTPDEAVQEMAKGVVEKDRHINFLKTQKIPTLESELESTKGKINTLQEELEKLRKAPPQAVELDATGELPDDFDQFDPDHVDSLVKAHKCLNQKIKDLEAKVSGTVPQAHPKPATPTFDPTSEFNQINLVTKNPEYATYFGLNRDVQEVEKDYVSFVQNIAILGGFAGNILTENGAFQPAVQQIISNYADANSQLKGLADKNGIAPPEDVGALNKVYKLRTLRNTYARKNAQGEMEPLSYDEAFKLMQVSEPQASKETPAMQAALAEQQRMARAVGNREQFARETKATDGVDLSSSGNAANARFSELIRKDRKTHSPTEKEFMSSYFKNNANYTDQEVEDWYKPVGQ